jgi:hypothetical protein
VERFNNKVKSRFTVCLKSVGRGLNSRREAFPHSCVHPHVHMHARAHIFNETLMCLLIYCGYLLKAKTVEPEKKTIASERL